MEFGEWLLQYKRKSVIRDLAGDARESGMQANWKHYDLAYDMLLNGACDDAWRAYKAAVRAYRRFGVALRNSQT